MDIKFCKVCGKPCKKVTQGLCKKHYVQLQKYGKVLDNNPRTVWDKNEIRIKNNIAEIDTYDQQGNVLNTFILDVEDVPKLGNVKWRTIYKRKKDSPYLCTGHTIYFHRLILGNPNTEIDHINRNTLDNRKCNLRALTASDNRINTGMRTNNTIGIKGVFFDKKSNTYHVEFRYNNKRYYSKGFNTIEEAAYMRYLMEQFFVPELSINNTEKVFKNRAKAWV